MRYALFVNITDGYTFNCDEFIGITSDKEIAVTISDASGGEVFYKEIPDGDFLVDNLAEIAKNNQRDVPVDMMDLVEAVKFLQEMMKK